MQFRYLALQKRSASVKYKLQRDSVPEDTRANWNTQRQVPTQQTIQLKKKPDNLRKFCAQVCEKGAPIISSVQRVVHFGDDNAWIYHRIKSTILRVHCDHGSLQLLPDNAKRGDCALWASGPTRAG